MASPIYSRRSFLRPGAALAAGSPMISRLAFTPVRAPVRASPEQLVRGSDWPHPTETHEPDDAAPVGLPSACCEDGAVHDRHLVADPARLYRLRPPLPHTDPAPRYRPELADIPDRTRPVIHSI